MKATWSRSLTLRLTLLFAVAAAFVLFLLGLLIGNLVEQHFEEQDMEALSGKMALTRHILERDSATQDGAALGRQLDDALTGHHGLAVAVFGPDRQVVYANEALTFPPALLDPQAAALPGRVVKWQAPEGLPWRGISAVVTAGPDGRTPFIIAIATEISHHEHFMSGFRGTLWVFIALATLAMGLLGWVVVRRGLAPLQTIKRRAAEITANHLHTRLPAEAIPQELADLADTLNDMLARLEESFQRLSDFSSDLAHELRTPVSNLLTQTQVTLSRARSDDEYRDILASNAEEFERLSRMIADMLFLAKADNQQIIPNRERVELADEVADLLEFYGLLAEEKAIRVTLSGAGAVTGDRLMLRRAVSNLLSNALRHTPDGGAVTIRLERQRSRLALTVENTGPGIPAEHLPRLFDRFYRADSSRQRTTEGSGLGLAITRSILLAHGGEVSVESADQRTRFTLTLPASD
ncbi:MAG: heavy metal sensor histidine kinase [Gammaproteobacteria bacterium]|nr:heavy metal sensor histidine kinase [Gammaproteobacteria bacterium]MBU1603283.1 heavy metal sensor histidine kinase [Gammaproteobacteria bacterium]MBU2432803.1 heavy metal sensor histidine kinase [Gammaproteobacteria bacterium]MBU2450046.1 heavy metal sensor histidine kinase [Gammaproteobacteria bacterium]